MPLDPTLAARPPAPLNHSLRPKVFHWIRSVSRHYVRGDDGFDVAYRSMLLLDNFVAASASAAKNDAFDPWTYQLASAASLSIIMASRTTTGGRRCPEETRRGSGGNYSFLLSSSTFSRRREERAQPEDAPQVALRRRVPAIITPTSSSEDLGSMARTTSSAAIKPNAAGIGAQWTPRSFDRYSLVLMSKGRFTIKDIMEMEDEIISTLHPRN